MVDAEKHLEDAGKAGTRKEGMDIEGAEPIAFPNPVDRTAENMAGMSSLIWRACDGN